MIDCNLQHIKEKTLKSLKDTGLGNILFQIATTIGLAKKSNQDWCVNDIKEVLKILTDQGGLHSLTIYKNIPIKKCRDPVYLKETINIYDNKFIDNVLYYVGRKRDVVINGYFQSYKYFEEQKKMLLGLFSPGRDVLDFIKKEFPGLFELGIETISLHIRNNWSREFRYKEDYYIEAINYVKKVKGNKNYVIFVFGDDMENIKKSYFCGLREKIIWVENFPDYIDLWCASLCKNNILSHSTLSWWSAYLNSNVGKVVVYPSDWIRHIYRGRCMQDKYFCEKFEDSHYPKDWVKLSTPVFF